MAKQSASTHEPIAEDWIGNAGWEKHVLRILDSCGIDADILGVGHMSEGGQDVSFS